MSELPEGTPPSRKSWWARRSLAQKVTAIAGSVFVALLALGLALPAPEPEEGDKSDSVGELQSPPPVDVPGINDDADESTNDADKEPAAQVEPEPEPEPEPAPDPVYTMRYTKLSATAGGALTVAGRTNLPDGTRIELTATRPFVNKGETEPRAARVSTVQLEVNDGAFTAATAIDETEVATFADRQFPVATVSANVHVCATVYTGQDFDGNDRQDSDVADVIGEAGEELATSPLAQEFGGATDTPSTMLELAKSIPAEPGDLTLLLREKQGSAPRVAALEGFCG